MLAMADVGQGGRSVTVGAGQVTVPFPKHRDEVVARRPLLALPSGLSEQEAAERRAAGQANSLPPATGRSYAVIVRENLLTFINVVLLCLALALVVLGRAPDAIVSVGVVLVNLLVSIVQELRAKHALDRIAVLTRPEASVVRDGAERRVDPTEIVMGDLLHLEAGDQIVADGVVVGGGPIDVDESLLTGESEPRPRTAGERVLAGSLCVGGGAYVRVEQVGDASLAYQLTHGARAFRRMLTPLQRQVRLIVRVLLLVAGTLGAMLAIAWIVDDQPLVESVKSAVVIVGLVPNGLFLAIATAYALGAMRLAGHGALVQQANAIESLSHVDVLCLDKTGTLTTGRLTLEQLYPLTVPEAELRQLLGTFAASVSVPNRTVEAIAAGCPGQAAQASAEVPFSSDRKWSAIRIEDQQASEWYLLGAPDVLWAALTPSQARAVSDTTTTQTTSGARLLLFARTTYPLVSAGQSAEPALPPLQAMGLVGLKDELRQDAREVLAQFAAAGVSVKLISGDHQQTVVTLAKRAGLPADARYLSGDALNDLDTGALGQLGEKVTIFGRMAPRDKERVVAALRGRGHYVAMVGDGLNDVLALKRADLAIAPRAGSQAARAVADLVLIDDSFSVLPGAFREGQRIVNGMRDILRLFLTRILYACLLIVAVAVIDMPFPLTPTHNALFTLLAVGLPTIGLAALARPAAVRPTGFWSELVRFIAPAGWTLTLTGLAVYLAFIRPDIGQPTPDQVRVGQTMLVTQSVVCGLFLVLFAAPPTRTWSGVETVRADWRVVGMVAVLLLALLATLTVPSLRVLFDLATIGPADLLLVAAIALMWAWLLRWVWRARLLERLLELPPSDVA
jgi:cation-transporting ATPase E